MFAIAFVSLGILLLLLLPHQTSWFEDSSFFVQPRFWPAISLIGMVVLGIFHLWHIQRRRFTKEDIKEVLVWLSALEFVVWFMIYVWTVPRVGYLPTTLIFVLALIYRMGYRSNFIFFCGGSFALLVVVVFKSILGVKIPGADLYEFLPDVIRNFFIIYL